MIENRPRCDDDDTLHTAHAHFAVCCTARLLPEKLQPEKLQALFRVPGIY